MTAQPACRDEDPDLFFPVGSGPAAKQQIKEAKAICFSCPIRAECLERALADPSRASDGIWGATTEKERRKLLERTAHQDLMAGIG